MKANIHFNHYAYKGEQNLVQDLHDEIIQILGVNVSYLPKESFNYDLIFGSDDDQRFTESYLIEMMLEQPDDYMGDALLGKFGVQIEETISLVVSQRRFDELKIENYKRPKEGDLIYFPIDDRLYTITFVDYQAPGFLQAGIFPGYRLSCELYTPSHEQIHTDVKHIDEADEEIHTLEIPIVDIVGRFAAGEQVIGQTTKFEGTVKKFYPRKKVLAVNHLNGLFSVNEIVIGQKTNAQAKISELIDHIDNKNSESVRLETNRQFRDEGDQLLDWDPTNPLA
tara:strand:- start:14826 stop:15668 length:843 start_codon:yes stop_codon:yes gene_type:complete